MQSLYCVKKTGLVILNETIEGNSLQLEFYVQKETETSTGKAEVFSQPQKYGYRWATLKEIETIKQPVERIASNWKILSQIKKVEWIPNPNLHILSLTHSAL